MSENEELTEKEELLEDIRFARENDPMQLIMISRDALILYLRSVIIFGRKSKEAKACLTVIKDMFKIIGEERKLLKLIEENLDSIDIYDAEDIVDSIDILNDETYTQYDSILADVDYACSRTGCRFLKSPSKIHSLLTDQTYKEDVYRLIKKEPTQQK